MTDEQEELQAEREAYLMRFAIKWVAIILVSFFVVTGSCSMHSNSYDADRINAEAKLVEAQSAIKKEQHAAIERLIGSGVDPLKARCAVLGTTNKDSTQKTICSDISRQN